MRRRPYWSSASTRRVRGRGRIASTSPHGTASGNPKPTKGDILRHPLMILLATFCLSGIMGTLFTQWIIGRQREAEAARSESEARKQAVQNFSRYVYERRARAEMLASALGRGANLDEVKDRKKLYDEAYVSWNANNQSNLLLIREVLGASEYTYIERVVEVSLVGKIFRPLDGCLTRAYDAVVSPSVTEVKPGTPGGQSSDILMACEVSVLLVLLCHKVLMTAGASQQPSSKGIGEVNVDSGDRVGDVTFGSERGSRGVDNLWVGEVP